MPGNLGEARKKSLAAMKAAADQILDNLSSCTTIHMDLPRGLFRQEQLNHLTVKEQMKGRLDLAEYGTHKDASWM